MSHAVETMAWTNEKPWHRLGKEVPSNLTTEQMLAEAQIDWTVSKRRMWFDTQLEGDAVAANLSQVPRDFALVRDSDNSVLDVVGPEYTPVQNLQAMEFFREFVEAGGATLETAGSLKKGKMVWVLANIGKSFKLAGKDEIKPYLLMANPHQQGKAQIAKRTAIRVVCNNTLTAALGSTASNKVAGVFRRAHRGEFDETAIENAKDVLGVAREQFAAFKETTLAMSNFKIDELKSAQMIADCFGDTDMADCENFELIQKDGMKATRQAIAALSNSPGHDLASAKGTLWGFLNAVTYTTDHVLRNSDDSRVFNAWFGRSAIIKNKAFNLAAAMTGSTLDNDD